LTFRSVIHHSIFISSSFSTEILIIYVDILLSESDNDDIEKAKEYFKAQFAIKDMGRPDTFLNMEYFFPIEVSFGFTTGD